MKKSLVIAIFAVIAGCAVALDVHHQMRRTAQMRVQERIITNFSILKNE